MKNIVLLSTLLFFSITSCVKKKEPKEFHEFFRFKLNGQSKSIGTGGFLSSGGGQFECLIQGDTLLFIAVGTGESVAFYIKDIKISDGTYQLNEKNRGLYHIYSTGGILKYGTTQFNTGTLTIKKSTYPLTAGTAKAMDGIFSFKAFDSVNNKTVEITDGTFVMERSEY